MINGTVVGIVEDNRDPDGMHRVKVRFPVDDGIRSSWCRMCSPMAGADRGLVILPDIGTEVVLMYATRSMSPYVLGAVYNGSEDKPEPYKNDDGNDDRRVFWSRNDHLVVFDDTQGAEKVSLGAKAPTRLQVESAPIHHVLDAAGKKITEKCEGSTFIEVKKKYSIKCRTFTLQATRVLLRAGSTVATAAPNVKITSGAVVRATSPDTDIKVGANAPPPEPADPAAPAIHPPVRH